MPSATALIERLGPEGVAHVRRVELDGVLQVHDETIVSGDGWLAAGKANPPSCCRYWMGSFRDGIIEVAPLNVTALLSHPRKFDIWQLYDDEVAAFKAGQKSFESIFTGPIKDNQGKLRIVGKPEIGALYDERGQWFVANVVG